MADLNKMKIRISLLVRSFFIQAFWNFHNFQAVGLLFVLNGIKKFLKFRNSDEVKSFYKRNYTFYNGHPYFSGITAGVIAKTEIESKDKPELEDTLIKFREAITSPLGAIGDLLLWSNLRPLLLTIPIYFYLLGLPLEIVVIFIFISFLLYNIYHLKIRWWAFSEGLDLGFNVCKKFNMHYFEKTINYLSRTLIITLSALLSSLVIDIGVYELSMGLTLWGLIIIIFLLRLIIRNSIFLIISGLFLIWVFGRLIIA